MNLPPQIGIAGLQLAMHVHISGGNLGKLRPTRIGKIGVTHQHDVAIGAMCKLKHIKGNL